MTKRHIILAILLIVTIGLIVSCSNDVASGSGYGSVVVYAGNNSRSVQPSAAEISFSYYVIHCSCSTSGINPIEKRFEGSSVKIENMVEGQWTLYVDGFNSSDELIGRSENQNFVIVRDSTTNLSFVLEPIEGEGTLSLSIQVQTSKVSSIDCTLKIGEDTYRTITMTSENRTPNKDGSYTFSKTIDDVASGFYSSSVTMKDSEEKVIGISLTPAIHIYANLESAYEFSWENLQNLLPKVDIPIPSVSPGRCFFNTEITFSTIEEGTIVWYSTNGIDYQVFNEPLFVVDNTTLYVYSTKPNLEKSEVCEYSYDCRVKTPIISLPSGKHSPESLSCITITDEDENAKIYYTLDGSNPASSNTRTEFSPDSPLSFTEDTSLKIIAVEDGFLNSEILEISYIVLPSPEPKPSLLSGVFSGDQTLSFDVPEGYAVYYTVDGSVPDRTSYLYSSPISVTETCTIKAITIRPGVADSSIITLELSFNDYFSINNGVVSTTDKKQLPSNVVIPVRVNGETVTGIGENSFSDCTNLKSIEIPSSVTSIGSNAFKGCTGLSKVNITDVEAWCKISFESNDANPLCYAKKLYLNNELVTDLIIPSSVTRIGKYAFYNCTGLESIEIPSSVTIIEIYAFFGCTGLSKVNITDVEAWCKISFCSDYSNPLYYAKELYLNNELVTDLIIPSSVTSIRSYAFYNCTGLKSIEIPSSVTSIGIYAFLGCSGLSKVNINDVETWCKISFSTVNANPLCYAEKLYLNNELVTDLIIPSSVMSIGNYAFQNCTGLKSIEIPSSVTSIGSNAFRGCTGLSKVNITDVEAWCKISFESNDANPLCYAKKLYLNNELVTDLIIPSSVTSIGSYAFYNCKGLESIEIPFSVTSIGSSVFYNWTSAQTISIQYGGFSASEKTWSYCSARLEVTIPSTTTSIGSYAFYNCTGLESIEIPSSVTSIGLNAFGGCTGLSKVNISDVETWCKISFSSCNSNPLYYAKDLYLKNKSVTYLIIPSSVTSIGSYAFYNCKGLKGIVIPSSVTSIGDYAFHGCTGLTSIEIPSSVTIIGTFAFYDCTGLAGVSFLGTKAQWSAVKKCFYWKNGVPATVVHCSDGNVSL